MVSRRSIFTVRNLLISVGFVALLMATNRTRSIFPVFAACIVCLAHKWNSDVLAERAAEGLTTSRWRRVRIAATSAAIAVAIIGSANLAFLLGYYGFLRSLSGMNAPYSWTRHHDILCNLIGFTT